MGAACADIKITRQLIIYYI